MTKIDLDDLERKARAVDGARPKTQRIGQYVRAMDEAPVTLALIARIRELAVIVEDYAADLDGEGFPRQAESLRAILERGAVLP